MGPQVAKTILKKKNKAGGLRLPEFKTYYKGLVIKIMWYWHKDVHVDKWNRVERPEINPHIYGQMTTHMVKGAKMI